MAESKGNPNAECHDCFPGVTEWSVGLWQVNTDAHPQFSPAAMKDPAQNAQAAYQVWQSQGWNAWSTYSGGEYAAYLGQCGGASSASPPPPSSGSSSGGASSGGSSSFASSVQPGAIAALAVIFAVALAVD